MTVSSTQFNIQYLGDGTTTVFAYPYSFFVPGDLTLIMVAINSGAVVMPGPVLNGAGPYGYTVTGTQNARLGEYLGGATITFNSAPPAGYSLNIIRTLALTQQTALQDNSPLPSAALEAMADRLTMIAQQIASGGTVVLGQVFSAPLTDPAGLNLVWPNVAQRAGNLAGFDASGNAALYSPATGSIINQSKNGLQAWYQVDNTYDPPVITQGIFYQGLVSNAGGLIRRVYFPIKFPTQWNGAVFSVSGTPTMGFTPNCFLADTDGQTYLDFAYINYLPNSLIGIAILAQGH